MNITLQPNELDYVYNVLAQRPYAEVAPLLAKIQAQVQAQQTPPLPVIDPAPTN